MGWCHEFGVDIDDGCGHPMVADTRLCRCEACGAVCEGRFKGCAQVWARGPLNVAFVRPSRNGRARPSISAQPEPESETERQLLPTIDAMRHELAQLTAALESAPRIDETERLLPLALDVPRRVEAALARAMETGAAADIERLEQLRSLVAATREAISWQASEQDDGEPPPAPGHS